MKIIKIIFVLMLSFASCKKEYSKIKIANSDTVDTIYSATVNESTGVTVRNQPSKTGKSIGGFSFGSNVKILRLTGKFEKIKSWSGEIVNGQWVEVYYPNKKNALDTCYVFDGFLNYKISKKKINTLVKNSKYSTTVNNLKGLVVRHQPNIEGKIIGSFNYGDNVEILELTGKFEKIKSWDDNMIYGQWVKVYYPNKKNILDPCFVFDTFLDYKTTSKNLKKLIPALKIKDTVIVKNEKEFLDALASNRMLIVDADTLNFESYSRLVNVEEIDENNIKSKRQYYQLNNHWLEIYSYENLILKGKKEVHFVVNRSTSLVLNINDCENLIVDNFVFYHLPQTTDCAANVCDIEKSKNIIFINSSFNGSGYIGANIIDSKNITFFNTHFYNNSAHAFDILGSTEILVENSIVYENESISLIEFYEGTSTLNIVNTGFIDNKCSSFLQYSNNIKSNVTFSNCLLKNNQVASNFISFNNSLTSSTLFDNCIIKDNHVFYKEWDDYSVLVNQSKNDKILFSNSMIENNYGLNISVESLSQVKFKNTVFIDDIINEEEDYEEEGYDNGSRTLDDLAITNYKEPNQNEMNTIVNSKLQIMPSTGYNLEKLKKIYQIKFPTSKPMKLYNVLDEVKGGFSGKESINYVNSGGWENNSKFTVEIPTHDVYYVYVSSANVIYQQLIYKDEKLEVLTSDNTISNEYKVLSPNAQTTYDDDDVKIINKKQVVINGIDDNDNKTYSEIFHPNMSEGKYLYFVKVVTKKGNVFFSEIQILNCIRVK